MAEVYFESTKTKKRYEVVRFDKERGTVTLRGEAGIEFDEKYRPAFFRQMGYTLKQG